jgi:hypothetical protein
MKRIKLAVPVLFLLAFSLVLAGCPGKQMSSGDSMENAQMMEETEKMDK